MPKRSCSNPEGGASLRSASFTCLLFLVGVAGLEPAASWSRTKRATKLRYTPFCSKIQLRQNVVYPISPRESSPETQRALIPKPFSGILFKTHWIFALFSRPVSWSKGGRNGFGPLWLRLLASCIRRDNAVALSLSNPAQRTVTVSLSGLRLPCISLGTASLAGYPIGRRQSGSTPSGRENASRTFSGSK